MLILGFVFGVGLVAFLFWYGSLPNERPRCTCGHEVREHSRSAQWGCRADDPSGLPCRCHYTRAQAAAAAKEQA
jgi:hypothetical protein